MKRNRFPVWQFLAGNAALFVLLFLFRWLTAEHDVFKLGWRPAHVDADTTPATTLAAITPTIMFEPTIGYGETLGKLLQNCAVHPSDIGRTISALQKIFDPRDLRAGHSIRVAIDSSGALQQLLYRPSPEIMVRVEREANGDLTGRCDTLALSAEAFLLTGEIETSVWQAVLDGGEKPDLLMDFTDIFQWDIDFFYDPQRGDRFRIFFEKLFVMAPNGEREFVRYGRILAASYEPKPAQEANTPEKFYTAFYFKAPNGRDGYFDRNGKSFQKTFLKSPLNYRRISSRFSLGRRHPILKQVRAHTGVDYAADQGTDVVASANGVVKEIGWKGGYGNCVVIEHKNHYATLYGHLSRFAESLKAGDAVAQNQVIGYVGSTGLSTGPHLHYTMYQNGSAINPLRMQPSSGDPIPAELMPRFIDQREALLQQLGLAPLPVPQPAP
jgi:murein DD-endopeptidase MepM/ murein hydrolase activator NlpD